MEGISAHIMVDGNILLEFVADIYGPTWVLSCICNTLFPTPIP